MKAVIALGCNIEPRRENLCSALQSLIHVPHIKILQVSALYETEPVGFAEENPAPFYNACVLVDTALTPEGLLGACLGIESAMGRRRNGTVSSRPIDLDLIACEGYACQTALLTLPHPRVLERAFVLLPLSDLFPEKNALGLDFSEALHQISKKGIQKLRDFSF